MSIHLTIIIVDGSAWLTLLMVDIFCIIVWMYTKIIVLYSRTPEFQVQFSLLSMGQDQLEIKNICDSLGIRLIAYSPLGLGMLTGKYTPSKLPRGPR